MIFANIFKTTFYTPPDGGFCAFKYAGNIEKMGEGGKYLYYDELNEIDI